MIEPVGYIDAAAPLWSLTTRWQPTLPELWPDQPAAGLLWGSEIATRSNVFSPGWSFSWNPVFAGVIDQLALNSLPAPGIDDSVAVLCGPKIWALAAFPPVVGINAEQTWPISGAT